MPLETALEPAPLPEVLDSVEEAPDSVALVEEPDEVGVLVPLAELLELPESEVAAPKTPPWTVSGEEP
jgi:hypothetical protein